MERSQMKPDRLYLTDAGAYFVSPDGVGAFWFDNMAEVDEQYGKGNFDRIYRVSHLTDF